MTTRSLTLLLAVVMTVCGGAAVPVSRVERAEACPIVWIAGERAEAPAAAEPAIAAHGPARPRTVPEEPRVSGRLFSPFLYERPPPALV